MFKRILVSSIMFRPRIVSRMPFSFRQIHLVKHQFDMKQRTSYPDRRARYLIEAVREGNFREARELVESLDVNSHDSGENTALTDACSRGDLKAVKFLVSELGASPYSSCDCPDHKTPIHYASEGGHSDIIKYFIESKFEVNVLDKNGLTPLDVARNNTIRSLLNTKGAKHGHNMSLEANKAIIKALPAKF